jgi:hypothetical protein
MNNGLSVAERVDLLVKLGAYMQENDASWALAKDKAMRANQWFTENHIELAVNNIIGQYLQKDKLETWLAAYKLPSTRKTVGIVMAGNLPFVGFHDFLCGFVSGHSLMLKLSSKDDVLMRQALIKLSEWEPKVLEQVKVAERLNNCDAYIATGSNNTARYFEQYFGKYPHIIRKNRTSVAIIDGSETDDELLALANDVYHYYGLGCRSVTQVCVPEQYDFVRLLKLFTIHNSYADLNKYKNNYDYHLAIYLLNRIPYMSNESLLMVENALPFSAVSVLHYRYYADKTALTQELRNSEDIQAIIGHGFIPFGDAQKPAISDYPDGIDTMAFLCGLQ